MTLSALALIALAVTASNAADALVYSGRDGRMQVALPRLNEEVRIDGVVDDGHGRKRRA